MGERGVLIFFQVFSEQLSLRHAYNLCQALLVSCIMLYLFNPTWSQGSGVKTGAFPSAAEINMTPARASMVTRERKVHGNLWYNNRAICQALSTSKLQLYPHEIWNLCFPKQLIITLASLNSKPVLHNIQENIIVQLYCTMLSVLCLNSWKPSTEHGLSSWQIISFYTV